ncbi:MAG: hypothetical protein EU529_13990 [Promethearchaeota archaeon]|nr:MAG: hypothetical protein EU529_13990 [Candidatus Lokiarchaeota archaeon]
MIAKRTITWKEKSLKKVIERHWSILVSLIILWFVMGLLLAYSFNLNEGHIVYALDDTYIHLAIAKNFSQKGVWGVTDEGFSSSSSSLLYSLLLSLIFLFGPNEIAPLIINLVAANLFLCFVYYILKIKYNLPPYATFTGLILLIFLIPLPFLIFTGMEHTIQIFIFIVFVYLASIILADDNIKERKIRFYNEEGKLFFSQDHLFLLVAPLVTMVRYEGMFLIIVIAGMFLLRKKFFYSFLIIGMGFLPIVVFGLISTSQGWYFFPNSVILKGNEPDFISVKGFLEFFDLKLLIKAPHISILLVGALLIMGTLFFKKKEIWNEFSIMALIFIGVTLMHLFLIGITEENQNLSRYDGYLVALGIILLFISINDGIPENLTISHLKEYFLIIKENIKKYLIQIVGAIFIIIVLFSSYIPRSYNLIRKTPLASNNIYEQPYQVGLFLDKYYDGECIAANDIGAMNFHADIDCLDLRGLGSRRVAKARIEDDFDTEFVQKQAEKKDCVIAIIFEHKDYGYDVPDEWAKAGEWTVRDNVVLGDDTISFWAVVPSEYNDLINNLKQFSEKLPSTVKESGNYTL